MTHEEFQVTQDRIGCKNSTLAKWMGVSPEHVSRWRNGKSPIPQSAEALLAALATGWRP